jgi:hypothetical protein
MCTTAPMDAPLVRRMKLVILDMDSRPPFGT